MAMVVYPPERQDRETYLEASLALPLLVLVHNVRRHQRSIWHWQKLVRFIFGVKRLLDRDAHMTPITALATIALILTDAPFGPDAGILATSAGALAIATLLTLAASLATRLGR